MREDFALGSFLEEHRHLARHDLSASECDPLPMSDLLAMADEDDLSRWRRLDLGYSDPRGAEWLREAIAERYHGASSREILCCAGAQEALACLVGGLCRAMTGSVPWPCRLSLSGSSLPRLPMSR